MSPLPFFIKIILNVFLLSWIIKPKPSAPPNSKDASGSHVYQLDLKKMKILPYMEYVQANMIKGKGKRKTGEEHGDDSPSKKLATKKYSDESLTDDDTMHI